MNRWEKAFLLKDITSTVSTRSNQVGSIQSARTVMPKTGLKRQAGNQNIRTLQESEFYSRK